MKKILICFGLLLSFSSAFADIYIQYYNKDSEAHTIKVYLNGQTKEVKFSGSTTSAVTVQGSGKKCILETKCGKIEIEDGAKIEIKDGCIKIL
jgi:hypothetical protein